MVRVQVIGLPGSGKSHGLKLWRKLNPKNPIKIIDIVDYIGPQKEKRFAAAARQMSPIIAESACGILLSQSRIIRLKPDIQTVYRQLEARGETPDPDYLSILESIMVPAHCIISSAEELPEAINYFL